MSEASFELGARVRVTAKGLERYGEAGEIVDFNPINDGARLAHVRFEDGTTLMVQTGQLEVLASG